jgi:hypothetical protein
MDINQVEQLIMDNSRVSVQEHVAVRVLSVDRIKTNTIAFEK